jgi:hypothetical protein
MTIASGIKTQTELSVVVPNEPGQLARLTGTLSAAGVNLAGLLTVHAGATARVKFVPEGDAAAARRGLEEAGYRPTETPVFALEGREGSDLAHRVVSALAAAGINIVSCYSQDAGGVTRFILAVDRPDLAGELLAALA